MDKKQTILTLAMALGTSQIAAASTDVDLRTLQLLKEEGISYDEFTRQMAATPMGGNYSNFSISDGNYSNFSISDSNYSNFSISDGNYSNFSISSSNYSNFSISGRAPALKETREMPAPLMPANQAAVEQK